MPKAFAARMAEKARQGNPESQWAGLADRVTLMTDNVDRKIET